MTFSFFLKDFLSLCFSSFLCVFMKLVNCCIFMFVFSCQYLYSSDKNCVFFVCFSESLSLEHKVEALWLLPLCNPAL